MLTAAINSTETPVASAAAFADATDGSPAKFQTYAKPLRRAKEPVRFAVALVAAQLSGDPGRRRRAGAGDRVTARRGRERCSLRRKRANSQSSTN